MSVTALGQLEEHLLVSAVASNGAVLADDVPEKLLRLPAVVVSGELSGVSAALLDKDVGERKSALLAGINQRNLGYFEQEVQKLDAWADDLKLGLEQEVKDIDREIKDTRKTAATAPTLDEKLHWQKRQRELESSAK